MRFHASQTSSGQVSQVQLCRRAATLIDLAIAQTALHAVVLSVS